MTWAYENFYYGVKFCACTVINYKKITPEYRENKQYSFSIKRNLTPNFKAPDAPKGAREIAKRS